MPILSVIAGPNGAGKSSITAALDLEASLNVIDPDAIARRLNPSDPLIAAASAARAAILRYRGYLIDKTSFGIETTLAGRRSLALIRQAKDSGYEIHMLYVAMSSSELHIERVRERVAQGGHDVPDDDIRRRYHRSLAHAPEALRLANEAVVLDNTGISRQRLLEIRNGIITWQALDLPLWAADLSRALSLNSA